MGTQRVQMEGVLPWMVCWASRAGTSTRNFCSALAVLVGPIHNTVFLTIHYFNHCVPIAQQAGQAAVLGRLSLIMRLYMAGTHFTFLFYSSFLSVTQQEGKKWPFPPIISCVGPNIMNFL
jgi:hypothetical protein